MNRAVKAILVTVGIFIALEIALFFVGVGMGLAATPRDANGLVIPGEDPTNIAAIARLNGLGTMAAIVLAVVGGIVSGVQRPRQ